MVFYGVITVLAKSQFYLQKHLQLNRANAKPEQGMSKQFKFHNDKKMFSYLSLPFFPFPKGYRLEKGQNIPALCSHS